jgi:hypothetical protein
MGKRVDKSNLTTCKKSTDGNMTINLTGTWTRQKIGLAIKETTRLPKD